MLKTTFTLAEAADLFNCHTETLRRAIHDGFLRAARLGREYRLSRSDLQAFWTARGGGQLFAPDCMDREEAGERENAQAAEDIEGVGNVEDTPPSAEKNRQQKDPASPIKQLSLIAPPEREP
jgi:excisionase family DNA binding protein